MFLWRRRRNKLFEFSLSECKKKKPYRLNADEKEQIAKAERERRRKIRILQVREISKKNAATIRDAVRHEKLKQLQKLADNINNEFNKSKQQQLQELEDNYEKSLRNIGRAHREASSQMENEDLKEISKSQNKLKAAYRYNAALERLHDDHVRKYVHENKHIIARKAALEKEKERAAQIASLPKAPPGIRENIQQQLCHVSVRNENMNQDEISYPGKTVVKRHHKESVEDGRRAAVIQEEKLDEQRKYEKSLAVEREQVAKIRFKKAIDKELLDRDSEKVMKELSFLQKKQMKQRQKQLSTVPKQVFLPPYKRAEALQDKQRIMEEKFEQFYVGDHMALRSDLNVLLEPHPPLESSHRTDSLDLTLTSDAETTPVKNIPNKPSVMKDITNVSLPSNQTAPTTKRQTLQTLFDRIKSQRDDWITDMAGNLQDAEVPIGKPDTGESSPSSLLPPSIESDALPQVFSPRETDERVQENVLKDEVCATMPLTNAVRRMEQIQKKLQQVSLTEDEDVQQEILEKSEDVQDMTDGDPARFQPTAIASHLQKQIAEVLEQKKRIQEQKKHLEDRLREFDEHQEKTSLHGYSFNPTEFPIPSDDPPERDRVQSPPNDDSSFVGHSKIETEDVLDQQISNSESPLSDLNSGIDLHNQILDQQSPDYLASAALKRLPKDIVKVQQYQQKMIHRHTERIKRIEEIQNEIRQNRKTLQASISGISLPEADPKFDQTPSKRIITDPLICDPSEHILKSTDVTTDVRISSQGNALLTGFQPGGSLPLSSEVNNRILPNENPSVDQIPYFDPEGLYKNSTDFLPAYQSCIQESIARNLFRSDLPGSIFNGNFQESNTVKEMYPTMSSFDDNVQHSEPEVISEPDTPILGTTSKMNSSCAFTPSFDDFDLSPGKPIPSSELQEIRKSLPFDETLEDSTQPTPVPSVTVSPHKTTFPFYNDDVVSETKDISTSVPSSSDDTEIHGEFQQIKMQLEDIRKQKAKLYQSLMDGHLGNQIKNLGQDVIASGLDMNDHVPLVSEQLSTTLKRHPPLLPTAYLYGHSPHELSAIQERDSSILSSHLSDMHSKLSLSSSVCSPSETTQTNIDQLVSGLEEKKLWNILHVLNHENLDNNNKTYQSENKPTSHSFATSTPFLSELKDADNNNGRPPTIITVPGEDQHPLQNANKIPQQLSTTTKTWAEILLEKSRLSANSESETSSSILQEVPTTNYDSQISLPTSTDTDSTVLRNFNFVPFVNRRNVCQDIQRNVLTPSPGLGSLHCEPKSCETSSDESRFISHVQTRDSGSFSTHAQESSESSSLANSEFHSRSSLTIDLLQNHKELSEFLSRILQTSEKFSSATLQSLPKAFSLNTDVQTMQNSPRILQPTHFSSTVSVSPSCKHEKDSVLTMYPSTVNDSVMSTGRGKVTSSELFQVTNTTSESVVAHEPTSCTWSPNSVVVSNGSDMEHGPTHHISSQNTANNIEDRSVIKHKPNKDVSSPSTVDNILNTTSVSPSFINADSKTNFSGASLISVIPLTSAAANQGMVSTADIGKPLEQSSPSQIITPLSLTLEPAYQINTAMPSTLGKMSELNSEASFNSRFVSTNSSPTISVSADQIRKEITQATHLNQQFILPSSTPQTFLESHRPTFPSNLSKLSQSHCAFPSGYDDANIVSSISANMISPIPQASSTSSSALTQYSISTSPESDNSIDIVNRFANIQNNLTQQVKNLSSNPAYSLSSCQTLSVSEGTAPSIAMKTMAGVELSKIEENLLPSVASIIASLSSSSSSSSVSSSSSSSSPSLLVASGPINLPQYQSPNQNSLRTNEISGNPDIQSLPSQSYQMQCMIQTQKVISLRVSGKLSPSPSSSSSSSSSSPYSSTSASSSDVKDTIKLDQSQIKPALTLPAIHDQPQSHDSTPVSSEKLSMTQYSYTSPETCDDPVLPQTSQIILPNPSTPPSDQLSSIVKEENNFATHASDFGPNLVRSLNDSGKYLSLTQHLAINQTPSTREGFKSSMSASCSSHAEKQASPSFVSLMCGKNTTGSASSSDTNPEKILLVEEPFQTTSDVDGATASAAVAPTSEMSNLTPEVSSPAEFTDSHWSSKLASSTDLSGLSQLSLPSDMMEDYQYLIRQARTLVKRGKADLLQEDRSSAYASGDSKLQSSKALVYGQTLFHKDEDEEEDELLIQGKGLSVSKSTDRDITEITETDSVHNQIFIFDQLGISDEPNLSLVSAGGDETPTVKRGNQAKKVPMLADSGLSSTDHATRIADNVAENKELLTSHQKLDIDSQHRLRPEQIISNSVAEWKLKYRMSTQTKK